MGGEEKAAPVRSGFGVGAGKIDHASYGITRNGTLLVSTPVGVVTAT